MSCLYGAARSKYSKDQLKKRYKKALKLPFNLEIEDRLLYIVIFSQRF
jgi:hypothetical protein